MKRTGLLLLVLSLILAACGTVAEPVFQADLEETQVAQAATSEAATASAPTATATATVTPTTTATEPPTETPTEAPTEAATDTPVPTEVPPTDTPQDTGGGEVNGDPAAGKVLFTTFVAQAGFACNTCHLNNSEARLIGPGLQHVGERAATRVEGLSAVEYIHQSIVDPSAYVVPDYPDMLMPHVFGDVFTEEQINDLVAYLMTL